MKKYFKKRYEVFWVRLAQKILQGRNVQRSMVVSRRDNNDMGYMAEKLDGVCDRMLDEYEHI